MSRTAVTILLAAPERELLEKISRKRSVSEFMKHRLQVVLAAATEIQNQEIAAWHELEVHFIGRWRNTGTQFTMNFKDAATRLAREVAPCCHKHGTRPFTIIAPYGRLKVDRQRLRDTMTGKAFISSAKLWKTAQNRHIVAKS